MSLFLLLAVLTVLDERGRNFKLSMPLSRLVYGNISVLIGSYGAGTVCPLNRKTFVVQQHSSIYWSEQTWTDLWRAVIEYFLPQFIPIWNGIYIYDTYIHHTWAYVVNLCHILGYMYDLCQHIWAVFHISPYDYLDVDYSLYMSLSYPILSYPVWHTYYRMSVTINH